MQDDDSDIEFELEASPAVTVDAVSEAVAHVKVSRRCIDFLIFFFFQSSQRRSFSKIELLLYTFSS